MNGKQVRFKVVESTLHFPGARHKIKEFQNLLNEDAVLTIAKKHPKRIKLTIEEGRLLVKLEKELREPKKIEVDGAKVLPQYKLTKFNLGYNSNLDLSGAV